MARNGSNREMPIANDKFLRKIAKSTERHFVREGTRKANRTAQRFTP
ncbi:MAG: hypothetical protein K0B11_09500 [Mariniphaga sp.]|nr:hypothetical protein [Mariniphaga sp.]